MDIGVDSDYPDLGKINGYRVYVNLYDNYPTFLFDAEFEVNISIGENWETVLYDAEDVCECKVCHGKGLKYIYYRIMAVIWKLFRINEYCACGTWHWHN